MNDTNEVKLISVDTPSVEQATEISKLQKLCFVDVDDDEAVNDFYHTSSIKVLAYIGNKLVGWAGAHITEQTYNERHIKLGGYGICTHPNFRHRGIATKVAGEAMKYLKENECDIGFLSVNIEDNKSIRLHQKYGFVMLPQHFSWTDSKGVVKEDDGGMVAPIISKELFKLVLSSSDPLYVGNGYW